MKNDITILATLIADALLTNGFGDVGDRLAIKESRPTDPWRDRNGEVDLGGRCRDALIKTIGDTVIANVLNVYIQPQH